MPTSVSSHPMTLVRTPTGWSWRDITIPMAPERRAQLVASHPTRAAQLGITAPARRISQLVKKSHPQYIIGFEFEGMVRRSVFDRFRAYLHDLGGDARGHGSLVQFGSDSSIGPIPRGYVSTEFRTKPLCMARGLELLEWILAYLYLTSETKDWITNESCGFHMNISEKGIFNRQRQIDLYAHILANFDEKKVLQRFGREGNDYCMSFTESLADPKDIKTNARYFRDHWSDKHEKKYFSIALRDSPSYAPIQLKNHRIEFRGMGNKDYHLRHEDLKRTINDMIATFKMAVKSLS